MYRTCIYKQTAPFRNCNFILLEQTPPRAIIPFDILLITIHVFPVSANYLNLLTLSTNSVRLGKQRSNQLLLQKTT